MNSASLILIRTDMTARIRTGPDYGLIALVIY